MFADIGIIRAQAVGRGSIEQLIGFALDQQRMLKHVLRILHAYQPLVGKLADSAVGRAQCRERSDTAGQDQQRQCRQREMELSPQGLRHQPAKRDCKLVGQVAP